MTCATCGTDYSEMHGADGTCRVARRYEAYRRSDAALGAVPLPWEAARVLMLQPCAYCCYAPAGGLDRQNNALGHVEGNVVPCCSFCNRTFGPLPLEAKRVLAPALRELRARGLIHGQQGWDLREMKQRRVEAPSQAKPYEEFWWNVDRSGDCWLWTGRVSNGYGVYTLEDGTTIQAHRLAYMLAVGPIEPPTGLVRHHCEENLCCRPEHLFVGDVAANARRLRKKRDNHSKLTPIQVQDIRQRHAAGEGVIALAREYRVTRQCVAGVVARRTFQHVL